jgi:hypothetical protein
MAYPKRYSEEYLAMIAEEILRARPCLDHQQPPSGARQSGGGARHPANVPWKELGRRYNYGKYTLWKLWHQAFARRQSERCEAKGERLTD